MIPDFRSPLACCTQPQASITFKAKDSNMRVNREFFPAHGTSMVFTPQPWHCARGVLATNCVSNCIVSRCLQRRSGARSAIVQAHILGMKLSLRWGAQCECSHGFLSDRDLHRSPPKGFGGRAVERNVGPSSPFPTSTLPSYLLKLFSIYPLNSRKNQAGFD